jgi:hypothetical protein
MTTDPIHIIAMVTCADFEYIQDYLWYGDVDDADGIKSFILKTDDLTHCKKITYYIVDKIVCSGSFENGYHSRWEDNNV